MTCDPAVTYAPLLRVAVVGGTHGNEMSGVFLTRHWLKDPAELQRQTFSAMPLLANPPAVEKCVRYLDHDLNRCFLPDMLSPGSDLPLGYEGLRAKELNQILGPRGSEGAMDFIIDLHNTTANIGDCLMINNSIDHLSTQLTAYIQRTLGGERCRVLALELSVDGLYDLTSVGKHDLAIELGPQPQGVIRAENVERMRHFVCAALDFIELFNQGTVFPECDLEVYRPVTKIDFPRDEKGMICAMIHPERQDKDWLPLEPGDPLFLTAEGQTIAYRGPCSLYPVFLNEAAYYEKGTALCCAERARIRVPAIRREAKGQ